MQILNFPQGSDEWLKVRLGVATASNFDKIITSTGKESATLPKYALELATQKLLTEPETSFENQNMKNGKEREPIARQLYSEAKLSLVKEVGMILSDCGNFGYSPDGLVGEEGLIEIKCPLSTTHAKYLLDGGLPSDYVQQVQGGLLISGRQWCDFISYHPNFEESKRLFIFRVFRQEEFIKNLSSGIQKTIGLRDEFLKKIRGAK